MVGRTFALALLFLGILACIGVYLVWSEYTSSGPLQRKVRVIIPKGAGVKEIGTLLVRAGVIENVFVFTLGVKYTKIGRRMRAGEFEFLPGVSMKTVGKHLVDGQMVKRRLTVPEGLITAEVLQLVVSTDGLQGTVPTNSDEGIYLPETYFFSYGDTRLSILKRMEKAMREALSKVWSTKSKKINIATVKDALILASIIEKETGDSGERHLVSSVFHNRLRLGLRLQSDPSVYYALTRGKTRLKRPLTRKDLLVESEYNTYRIKGLPLGPISNPGKAALRAAVNPVKSDYLYFVANGRGGHFFSKSLKQHNRNVAIFRSLKQKSSR
ncbi:MAG: endolytic transglycosylase MltG [Pseudomonadota bacterium]|nr:endolytic transglycosylase MltG [Pseudomonadota bacterium]